MTTKQAASFPRFTENETLEDVVRRLHYRLSLKPEKIGSLLGLSRTTISRYEKGDISIEAGYVAFLAKLMADEHDAKGLDTTQARATLVLELNPIIKKYGEYGSSPFNNWSDIEYHADLFQKKKLEKKKVEDEEKKAKLVKEAITAHTYAVDTSEARSINNNDLIRFSVTDVQQPSFATNRLSIFLSPTKALALLLFLLLLSSMVWHRPAPVSQEFGSSQYAKAEDAYRSGCSLYNQRDLDRAIADLNTAINLRPEYAEALVCRGRAYYDKGDNERAKKDFDQAIKVQPNYAEGYFNRGRVYLYQGKHQLAIDDFKKTVALSPRHNYGYFGIGKAYYELDMYREAVDNLNQAIEIKNDYPWSYIYRGLAHKALDQCEIATRDLNKAIDLNKAMPIPDLDGSQTRATIELKHLQCLM